MVREKVHWQCAGHNLAWDCAMRARTCWSSSRRDEWRREGERGVVARGLNENPSSGKRWSSKSFVVGGWVKFKVLLGTYPTKTMGTQLILGPIFRGFVLDFSISHLIFAKSPFLCGLFFSVVYSRFKINYTPRSNSRHLRPFSWFSCPVVIYLTGLASSAFQYSVLPFPLHPLVVPLLVLVWGDLRERRPPQSDERR